MARGTQDRDYDIGRILADHERRLSSLERRLKLAQSQIRSIGLWESFTPSWVNVTVGTGGISAGRFTQIGQTVHVAVQLVLGTGGDVTGAINLNVPLAANLSLIFNSQSVALSGVAGARDDSAGALEKAAVQLLSSGLVRFTPTDVAGGQWAAAVPFDWAVNDQLNAWFSYETTVPSPG